MRDSENCKYLEILVRQIKGEGVVMYSVDCPKVGSSGEVTGDQEGFKNAQGRELKLSLYGTEMRTEDSVTLQALLGQGLSKW